MFEISLGLGLEGCFQGTEEIITVERIRVTLGSVDTLPREQSQAENCLLYVDDL